MLPFHPDMAPNQGLKAFPQPPDAFPLAFSPTAIGYQDTAGRGPIAWDNRGRHNGRGAPYGLFQYTLSGAGWFRDSNGEHQITTGHGFLTVIPSATGYGRIEGQPWEWIWLGFTGDFALDFVERLIARFGRILTVPPDAEAIRLLAQMYADAQQGWPRSPWQWSALGHQLLMELAAAASQSAAAHPPAVAAALALIESRYTDPGLTLDRIAAEAGLSKFHLSRLFRKHTGQSPGAWVIERRLRHAADLLSFTQLSIKEISAQSGYRDYNHFVAAFRKWRGVPPGVLRKSRMFA